MECLALGMEAFKEEIVEILKELLLKDGILIRGVYERSDAKVRLQEGMERFKGFIGDPFPTKVEITENGVRYIVDVEDGQKTGLFPGPEIQQTGNSQTLPPTKRYWTALPIPVLLH